MAVKTVTNSELGYLRRDGQWSKFYLSIDQPDIAFWARVSATPSSTDKLAVIGYTSASGGGGMLTDVLPGMTIAVGNAVGGFEKGFVRVRTAPDGVNFYIGETSEINWQAGDYLTVLDEFGLWPRHIHIGADKKTPYVDYNIAYSDQHTVFAPVVVAGPDPVLWLTSGSASVSFDASESWVLGGSTITYSWTATGAAITSGLTTSTPSMTYTATGRYRVSCTATANGKSTNRYWTVQVYGANRAPVTQFVPAQVTSDDTGMSFTVTMYAEADIASVRNRARVILFAVDYYGDTQISLGPMPGRENIVAAGWIVGETIDYSAELSTVTFEVKGPGYWLQQMAGFPSALENTSGTASAWTNFHNLTLDKALYSMIYYRSTASLCMDWSLSGNTYLATEFPAPGSTSLWEQINTFAYQSILAKPIVDQYERLYVQVETNLTPPAQRGSIPTVMTLTPQDWRDKLTLTRNPTDRCSLVDLSGVYHDGASVTTLFSLSYGNVYGQWGAMQRLDRLVLGSQAQGNELAGMVLAQQNNNYPALSVTLAANNRMINTAPRQYVKFSLAASGTPRGVTLTNLNLIPKRVSYNIDMNAGTLFSQWEFEGETFPSLAVTGISPVTAPDPGPSPAPVPVNPGDSGSSGGGGPSDLVYALFADGLYRTRNFSYTTSGSAIHPNWTQIGLEMVGNQQDFVLDPETPRNVAYVGGDNGIWKTTNLDSYANFSQVLTPGQFLAAVAYPTVTGWNFFGIKAIRTTIASPGRLYCIGVCQDPYNVYYAAVGRSSDYGVTWAFTTLDWTTNALHGLAASQVNADVVYAAANNGRLFKSINGGVAFFNTYNVSGADRPIANIDVPYVNGDDSVVLIGGKATDTPLPDNRSITWGALTASYNGSTVQWRSNSVSYYDNGFVANFSLGTLDGVREQWIMVLLSQALSFTNFNASDVLVWRTTWLNPSGQYQLLSDDWGESGWQSPTRFSGHSWSLPLDPSHYGVDDTGHPYNEWHGTAVKNLPSLDFQTGLGRLWDHTTYSTLTPQPYTIRCELISVNGTHVSIPPYVMKSTDSGNTFTNITPPGPTNHDGGGAVGWRGLHSDVQSRNHLTALVGSDPASLDLVVSSDGGTNWTTRQTAMNTPVALGRWPYNGTQAYVMTNGDIFWTPDDFDTLISKVGDVGGGSPRVIVPVWVQS